ncbi:translation initiation factor IF-2 [Candidatus Pacearchaeota archaeon]|nr:translation initiation factor IF-2 [Candidatus Pacearchaeota archaeon]
MTNKDSKPQKKQKQEQTQIRQPIVTVCGHVDHGKTSILDALRKTSVQAGESGGITQKISFTKFPADILKKSCPLIESSGIKLNIPGFLFIDTPGHAAFTNLRKRGGALADLAVLVIDINEGIKPQTAEVIKILQHNKTPFIIALNKIDNISGWKTPGKQGAKNTGGTQDISLKQSISSQQDRVKQVFNERYMTLIGSLNNYGFDADLYYNINDFSKKIALVPTSAETNQGLQELIMVLCGLSQKYLSERLELGKDAKGVMLEVKTEKTINYNEAILYDGELSRQDKIAVANFENPDKPIITKIRILEEIQSLSNKFKPSEKAVASTGLRMQLVEKANVLPGMPFEVFKDNLGEIKEKFKKELSENVKTDKKGIIAKADSLGSLEALLALLKEKNIPVVKAGIGNVSKTDLISAKANLDINELDAVIVGFNVDVDEEVGPIKGKIKIITDDVIYKLIEDLVEFRQEKAKEIEKRRLMELATIAKVDVLHKYVFRNTKPAIFGVKIKAGKINSGLNLIDEKGEKVGRIKNIQSENKSVEKANKDMEVAISVPGINFERQMKDKKTLYSDISESQFKKFKKNKDLLSGDEIKTIQEIAEIKRKEKPEWGM